MPYVSNSRRIIFDSTTSSRAACAKKFVHFCNESWTSLTCLDQSLLASRNRLILLAAAAAILCNRHRSMTASSAIRSDGGNGGMLGVGYTSSDDADA